MGISAGACVPSLLEPYLVELWTCGKDVHNFAC